MLSHKRGGRFTASEIHKILKPKGFGETGLTYIKEVTLERLGVTLPSISSPSTEHGKRNEQFAKDMLFIERDIQCLDIDFKTHKDYDFVGASPDGITKDGILIEIKCPYNLVNHLDNLSIKTQDEFKKQRFIYFCQVQCQMWCVGLDKAYFVSFSGYDYDDILRLPNKSLSLLEVSLDTEFIAFMEERVILANETSLNIIENL